MVISGTGECSQCPYVGELGDGLCITCYDRAVSQQSRKSKLGYSLHLSRIPKNRRKDDPTPSIPTTTPTPTSD